MRVHDLFCTNYDYEILDIPQTFTRVEEDQKVKFYNSKDAMTHVITDTVDIAEAARQEGTFDVFEDSDDVVKKIKETLDNEDEPFLAPQESPKFKMVEDDEETKKVTLMDNIDY